VTTLRKEAIGALI